MSQLQRNCCLVCHVASIVTCHGVYYNCTDYLFFKHCQFVFNATKFIFESLFDDNATIEINIIKLISKYTITDQIECGKKYLAISVDMMIDAVRK